MTANRDVETRIWRELEQALTNVYYIEGLMDQQTTRQKWYNGMLALISGGGGISAVIEMYNSNRVFQILSYTMPFLVSLSIIFNQFSSLYIRNSNEMAKLSKLYVDFSKYSDLLHNLFTSLYSDSISSQKALSKLTDLNSEYASKKIEASNIFGDNDNKIEYKAKLRCQEYLNSIYNYGNKEE